MATRDSGGQSQSGKGKRDEEVEDVGVRTVDRALMLLNFGVTAHRLGRHLHLGR